MSSKVLGLSLVVGPGHGNRSFVYSCIGVGMFVLHDTLSYQGLRSPKGIGAWKHTLCSKSVVVEQEVDRS